MCLSRYLTWLLRRSSLHTLPSHLLPPHDAPARIVPDSHTPPTPCYSADPPFFPSVKFFAPLSITQASLVLLLLRSSVDTQGVASLALGYCLLPFQDVTQQLGSALAIPGLRRLP